MSHCFSLCIFYVAERHGRFHILGGALAHLTQEAPSKGGEWGVGGAPFTAISMTYKCLYVKSKEGINDNFPNENKLM